MSASGLPELCEIQTRFHEAMLSSDDTALAPFVTAQGSVAARVAVYRTTVQSGLAEVLAAAFPIVRRVVGHGFFANLASTFITASPPALPQLLAYGGGFADFIAGHDVAKRLPYLAGVARLEWARNESYFAADASPLDPARLAALSPDVMAQTVLKLHPATRLITSNFPIHRIWEVNQPEVLDIPEVDMTEAQSALVSRKGHHIVIRPLALADTALVAAIASGTTLEEAADVAVGVDSAFDLQTALQNHFISGVFQNA